MTLVASMRETICAYGGLLQRDAGVQRTDRWCDGQRSERDAMGMARGRQPRRSAAIGPIAGCGLSMRMGARRTHSLPPSWRVDAMTAAQWLGYDHNSARTFALRRKASA